MCAMATIIPLSAVVARTPSNGIGYLGELPWKAAGIALPGDLKYFRQHTLSTMSPTKQNAVIMGRKTWESIPLRFKPLPGRINFVLTKNREWATLHLPPSVHHAASLDEALVQIDCDETLREKVERAVVIGGVKLFEETMFHPRCDIYHVTEVMTDFKCDTFLTEATQERLKQIESVSSSDIIVENNVPYRFFNYFSNSI